MCQSYFRSFHMLSINSDNHALRWFCAIGLELKAVFCSLLRFAQLKDSGAKVWMSMYLTLKPMFLLYCTSYLLPQWCCRMHDKPPGKPSGMQQWVHIARPSGVSWELASYFCSSLTLSDGWLAIGWSRSALSGTTGRFSSAPHAFVLQQASLGILLWHGTAGREQEGPHRLLRPGWELALGHRFWRN